MFYKQFLKITDVLDEKFVNEFDFWLTTLPDNESRTISVSTVASRFCVKYSVADALIKFSEKEKILQKRYMIICGNEDCSFFYKDCEENELTEILGEKVHCHNCDQDFEVTAENVFIVYARKKMPNIPERIIEEEIRKRIGVSETEDYENFSYADSLAKNISEIYNLYYNPDESAYIELKKMKNSLDGPFETTKQKGDALERLVLYLFCLIKNVNGTNKIQTFTNQFDCTVRFPQTSPVFPTVLKLLTPYFIIECKNEVDKQGDGKTPSNTYFHKLSDIMTSTTAQVGIVVSRGAASKEDLEVSYQNYLLHKNSNQQKVLISLSDEDLSIIIDKKINLLEYLGYKVDMLTMNAKNASYEMFAEHHMKS